MTSVTEWHSWALRRVDLTPAQVADRVLRRSGLPDVPEAREVVELHLCALDVSLDVGSPELLAPQLSWEGHRWSQVATGPGGPVVWASLRSVLADHLDELTLLSVAHHVEAAEVVAASRVGGLRARRDRTGLAGLSGDVGAYLAHAVAGRHESAVDHVLHLAEAGWTVPELLLGVVAPAQEELGRLWERGAIDVAQEHMATAVTHLAMYALYPHLVSAERLGLSLVAATPPGDTHSVGLRMVTDLLHLRGWEVFYVGTSCPTASVVEAVVNADATLLLLGASMTCHLPGLRAAIREVRADHRCDGTSLMVGGRPFRAAPTLRTWVGADLVAGHAVEAVEAVDALLDPEVAPRTEGS